MSTVALIFCEIYARYLKRPGKLGSTPFLSFDDSSKDERESDLREQNFSGQGRTESYQTPLPEDCPLRVEAQPAF